MTGFEKFFESADNKPHVAQQAEPSVNNAGPAAGKKTVAQPCAVANYTLKVIAVHLKRFKLGQIKKFAGCARYIAIVSIHMIRRILAQ